MKLPLELLLIISKYCNGDIILIKSLLFTNRFNITLKKLCNINYKNLSTPTFIDIDEVESEYCPIFPKVIIVGWTLNNELHRMNGPALDYVWYKYGKKHRDNDLPAFDDGHGHKEWWFNGQRHRDNDKYAVIWNGGNTDWYYYGKRHRENGPAIVCINGHEEWIQNGQYHREDGPAVTFDDNTRIWCKYGEKHRIDGPAVIYWNGKEEYWENGVKL